MTQKPKKIEQPSLNPFAYWNAITSEEAAKRALMANLYKKVGELVEAVNYLLEKEGKE